MVISARADVLPVNSPEWGDVLERLPHDVYHTAAYHRIPAIGTDVAGTAYAFVYEEGSQGFLWPYLLVPIAEAPGYYDVTSAYGYSGPVATPDPAFLERAWQALLDHWKAQGAVSAFTRFHPLLENARLLKGITDEHGAAASAGVRTAGVTVSIDLTIPPREQIRRYQKRLRQTIRKLHETGFEVTEDPSLTHIGDFVRLYNETMARLGSRPEYRLDVTWFDQFHANLGGAVHLFVGHIDGRIAAADVVLEYGPYVHSHLAGIASEFVDRSPSKGVLDFVRAWGAQRGRKSMHLGGGVGGRRDSLFDFKRRFSQRTHRFETGGWILNRSCYRELEERHRAKLAAIGAEPAEHSYFPAHRRPPSFPPNSQGERF